MKFIVPYVSLVAGVAASESDAFDSKASARLALLKAQHFKTKRAMMAKRQKLDSSNALRNFKPAFMQQDDIDCDWTSEETCYDENYNAVDCVPYADGGCPCPEGQERCGAYEGYAGYCVEPEFCCESDEEICYDDFYNPTGCVAISDGGCPCPEGETKCDAVPEWNITGYCTDICCSDEEETCYDENYYNAVGCAAYSEGGCPCPEGQEKCGGTDWWPGTCTTLCCEEDEETCYDENYLPTECKSIAEGGCPCPEGEEKCGAYEGYAGHCIAPDLCCADDEELCYSDHWEPESCASISTGGCACPGEQVKCHADPEYNMTGWCVDVCCTDEQELCYDYDTGVETCADIASGGCPCPEGEEKCGAYEGYAGYCIAPNLCCADDEELCYSDDWEPESCASISTGGCACPEGEIKCGAEPDMNYAGFCTSLCCEEEICYDWSTYEPTSCAAWDEECPTGTSFAVMKRNAMTMIDETTIKNQVAKLNKVKAMKAKMLAHENADYNTIEKISRAEEIAILRKAKRDVSHKFLNKGVPVFMTKVY